MKTTVNKAYSASRKILPTIKDGSQPSLSNILQAYKGNVVQPQLDDEELIQGKLESSPPNNTGLPDQLKSGIEKTKT